MHFQLKSHSCNLCLEYWCPIANPGHTCPLCCLCRHQKQVVCRFIMGPFNTFQIFLTLLVLSTFKLLEGTGAWLRLGDIWWSNNPLEMLVDLMNLFYSLLFCILHLMQIVIWQKGWRQKSVDCSLSKVCCHIWFFFFKSLKTLIK